MSMWSNLMAEIPPLGVIMGSDSHEKRPPKSPFIVVRLPFWLSSVRACFCACTSKYSHARNCLPLPSITPEISRTRSSMINFLLVREISVRVILPWLSRYSVSDRHFPTPYSSLSLASAGISLFRCWATNPPSIANRTQKIIIALSCIPKSPVTPFEQFEVDDNWHRI